METGGSTLQKTILSKILNSLQPEPEGIITVTQMGVYIRFLDDNISTEGTMGKMVVIILSVVVQSAWH